VVGHQPQDDPLALDRETMRELGHRVVDLLVDRLLDEGPPLRRASPAEMRKRLGGPPPTGPQALEDVLERLERDVLPYRSRVDHPGFLAFIPGSGTWPGALADLIASACNVYAGSWMESAGPSQVELEVLGWFKDWIGYPAEAAGSLTSGGSAANMTALACAREAKAGPMRDDLVLYVSDQAHSSIARAARILGFRPGQVRVLPSDAGLRLEPETLAAAIEADLRAGRSPLAVSANAGATNSGVTDPLPELAEVCRQNGVWLHVDAAYGGFAVLSERGRAELSGLELADSLTLDPHKWLYQPFECGCVLVRDGALLRAAFELAPDYQHPAHGDGYGPHAGTSVRTRPRSVPGRAFGATGGGDGGREAGRRAPLGRAGDNRAVIDPLERWREHGEKPDYAGLLTFGSLPYTQDPAELEGVDVAIVGAPADDLVSDRPGARFGPRAIRAASCPPGPHLEAKVDATAVLRIVDYGDAPVLPADPARTHEAIERTVGEVVAAGAIPVVLGGDHSIAEPDIRACAAGRAPVGLVHFDTHTDTGTEVFGVEVSHGTPMYRLVEAGVVDPRRYVQIGLRGYWPGEREFRWQEERGIASFFMHDVRRLGIEEVVGGAIDVVGAGPVFLSVDVDVLDPAFAPGTGTPEPGGMESGDLLWACRRLAQELELVGTDVVEVIPTAPGSDITALVADRIVREILTGLALRRR